MLNNLDTKSIQYINDELALHTIVDYCHDVNCVKEDESKQRDNHQHVFSTTTNPMYSIFTHNLYFEYAYCIEGHVTMALLSKNWKAIECPTRRLNDAMR